MQIAGTLRGQVFQPELVVTLEVGARRIPMSAIVDSGADMTIVPAEPRAARGFDYSDMEVIPGGEGRGVGQECRFEMRRLPNASLSWRGNTFTSEVLVAEPNSFDIGLLGREDFFNVFRVSFEGWRDQPPWMDVDPYPRGVHLA